MLCSKEEVRSHIIGITARRNHQRKHKVTVNVRPPMCNLRCDDGILNAFIIKQYTLHKDLV